MAASVLAPITARPWPRQWSEQEPLLEAQHDRLEAQLHELLRLHDTDIPPGSQAERLALDLAFRRLLWDLRLHLRLEERWLGQRACLCSAHRQAHADAARLALEGYGISAGDRQARRGWLVELHSWFSSHRNGPDRNAYALASSLP